MDKEINPLECPNCGNIAGAPATARIHANKCTLPKPENVQAEEPVEEKPKKAVKKK